jgi:hypothetical protein
MPYALCFFKVGGMNSYLVRIYRRAEDNPRMLVGVVEEVGGNDKRAFHNLYELWDILNSVKKERMQSKRSSDSKRNRNMKQN